MKMAILIINFIYSLSLSLKKNVLFNYNNAKLNNYNQLYKNTFNSNNQNFNQNRLIQNYPLSNYPYGNFSNNNQLPYFENQRKFRNQFMLNEQQPAPAPTPDQSSSSSTPASPSTDQSSSTPASPSTDQSSSTPPTQSTDQSSSMPPTQSTDQSSSTPPSIAPNAINPDNIKKINFETTNRINYSDSSVPSNLFLRQKTEAECYKYKIDKINYEDDINYVKANKLFRVKLHKIKDVYTTKRVGFDASAYLFDYLDNILQSAIVEDFREIWKNAIKINNDKVIAFDDPYSLRKILYGLDTETKPNTASTDFLLDYIGEILPNFAPDIWKSSLNNSELNTTVHTWDWDLTKSKEGSVKYMINHYDFNGDGKLNIREYLLASIHMNYERLGTNKCSNCHEKVIKELIDPLFEFCDCDKNNFVSAEELWNGLQLIKNSKYWNFFNCKVENRDVRTDVINDFILKIDSNKIGLLSKKDFRYGILLGYWNRQTQERDIASTNMFNGKEGRWHNGYDTKCDELNKAYNNLKDKEYS